MWCGVPRLLHSTILTNPMPMPLCILCRARECGYVYVVKALKVWSEFVGWKEKKKSAGVVRQMARKERESRWISMVRERRLNASEGMSEVDAMRE